MVSCEKCWRDAGGNPDEYHRLLAERDCTPEQQAGPEAKKCPECGRIALHQHVGDCMACDYEKPRPAREEKANG